MTSKNTDDMIMGWGGQVAWMVKWWGGQGTWDAWGGHGGKVVRVVGVVSVVTQSGHSDTLWIVPDTHLEDALVSVPTCPNSSFFFTTQLLIRSPHSLRSSVLYLGLGTWYLR